VLGLRVTDEVANNSVDCGKRLTIVWLIGHCGRFACSVVRKMNWSDLFIA
jgi:hypothetical protein